jgi:sugar lactone lactonase YvrE
MKKLLIASLALCALLPASAGAKSFPDTIALPDGWLAEGIATGKGPTFYAGSRADAVVSEPGDPTFDGAIYRGSYRTGAGSVLVPGREGRAATGLKYDRRGDRLFVAGAGSKRIYVYDASTGAEERIDDVPEAGFINDVVITRRAAYFTDSQVQQLYKIPIRRNGRLGELKRIPITGDLVYTAGFNANGIEATPNGKKLIIVKSNTGQLFRANRRGVTREIELDQPVTAGDGILLMGRTLVVDRNQNELLSFVRLDRRLRSGDVQREITDARFDVPTTIARFGGALYAVNARFPPTADNHNPREDVIRVKK